MHITSVEGSKKNKDKLLIYVDNNFSFSISEEEYVALNLYEDKDITEEEYNHIKYNIYYRSAKCIAVKYLSLKIRTEAKVVEKLVSEAFDEGTIADVIDELKSIGYLNDRIYAQKFLYDRSKLKPKAKKLLRLELLSKGVSEEVADEVLNDWEIDESVIIENLIKRKFGKYDLTDVKVFKKAFSFLQHRGFSYDLIAEAMRNRDLVD